MTSLVESAICILMGFYIKVASLSILLVCIVCDKFYANGSKRKRDARFFFVHVRWKSFFSFSMYSMYKCIFIVDLDLM